MEIALVVLAVFVSSVGVDVVAGKLGLGCEHHMHLRSRDIAIADERTCFGEDSTRQFRPYPKVWAPEVSH